MGTINYYVGDERPNFSGTATWTDSPDLSGATVTLTAKTKTGTVGIASQDATITIDNDAKTIDWSYETTSADFSETGTYYLYLTVTFSGGDVQSIPLPDQVVVKRPYG